MALKIPTRRCRACIHSQGGTLSLLFPDFHAEKLGLLHNVLVSKWSLMSFGIHRKHPPFVGPVKHPLEDDRLA